MDIHFAYHGVSGLPVGCPRCRDSPGAGSSGKGAVFFSMLPCRLVGTGLPSFQSMVAGQILSISWHGLWPGGGNYKQKEWLIAGKVMWFNLWDSMACGDSAAAVAKKHAFLWHHCDSRLLHIRHTTLRSCVAKVRYHVWQSSFSESMASIWLSRICGTAWLYNTSGHFMTL